MVLDSVVERKQLGDFLGTVRAHRHYHSQKVRLRRCGLPRAYYLVEGGVEAWPHAAERERMRLELASIDAADGLLVHEASSTAATVAFLGGSPTANVGISPTRRASQSFSREISMFFSSE